MEPCHIGRSLFLPVSSVEGADPLASAKEGVPSSRALVLQERTTSPHTPVRSRLVFPSFSISLLSTRCKTPPVARRSRTEQLLQLQFTWTLDTHSFNILRKKDIDTRLVARSFPGLKSRNPQLSSCGWPTGFTENPTPYFISRLCCRPYGPLRSDILLLQLAVTKKIPLSASCATRRT